MEVQTVGTESVSCLDICVESTKSSCQGYSTGWKYVRTLVDLHFQSYCYWYFLVVFLELCQCNDQHNQLQLYHQKHNFCSELCEAPQECFFCPNFWCRASEFPRDYDGACVQMRLAYSPAAHFLLFLVRWTDCSLAGALGLLRILIYKVSLFNVLVHPYNVGLNL